MPEKKKLPVGIDNFKKIIKNNFYYVDKTEMICSLIRNWSEVNLFTRPRRFGKSLIKLDPYDKNTLFLFCGRRSDRIKALLWEGDGFLLMYKRLDNGAFRWPRSTDEAMSITKDQYRMLMQGLEIVARYPIEELKETPSIM